ncbi:FG-GAP-like repeat-containing protein [Streptomyces sp. NPDC004609]|uniref:FG-GAP-like repeat-containing protein n=1 Tax=Streptomyces sp. NPDC004609 TaxID=3364704 RepID=UPI0036942483
MGRTALPRGRAAAAALVTTSLVLSATAVLPTGTAFAATPAPWSTVVTLAKATTVLRELVVTTDGTAVALWDQYDAGANRYRLYAATRPAGNDTWNSPAELGTSPHDKREAKLLARADGSVVALWTERPSSSTGETRVLSASLPARSSTGWSAPTALLDLSAKVAIRSLDLAEGPGGRVAAAWVSTPLNTGTGAVYGEVYIATREADGTWRHSLPASNVGAYDGFVLAGPQVALDAGGNAVVAYTMSSDGSLSVMTNSRDKETGVWGTPTAAATPAWGMSAPALATDASGWVHIVWKDPNGSLQVSHRVTANDEWSAPVTAVSGLRTGGIGVSTKTPEPLHGPDGDITLVWYDESVGSRTTGIRTVSFDSPSGTWGAPKTLSTAYPETPYDVSIARDGSVHAAWLERNPASSTTSVMQSSRIGDAWTNARAVPGYGSERAEIASAGGERVTAVWDSARNGTDRTLNAVRAAWPKPAVTSSSVPGAANLKGSSSSSTVWAPRWTSNSAVANWTLTLADPAGRTLRTLTGTPGSTSITAIWNGRTSSGALAPNGRLTWTLKAVQAGSGTGSTLATGSLSVAGGATVHRDFGSPGGTPDGLGDLLTLSSAGKLQYLYGSLPAGDLSTGKSGSGWSSSVIAVPFGDLTGDRCNDLLVRTGDSLRLYKPGCGAAPSASTPYTTLGTGWGQYDILTPVGDVTKDSRPDMIVRAPSTGAVYLYKGTSDGKLASRVKLYADWRGYKKIVGTGDLNGDGVGDLLAQDKSNELWRYDGTGSGTFKARVKLADDWGSSYNVIVGTGDLNSDGKADLLARDTAGNLYRSYGTGKGTFSARKKVNAGFNSYKALF